MPTNGTKGKINPTSRVSLTASQAGENSQTNGPEHTILSSILTDLIIKRNNGRRAVSTEPTVDFKATSSNEFEKSNFSQMLSSTLTV
jgi:hypothetical protein